MKVAILGDLHFGASGDSARMHAYQKRFFEECLFPTLKERNVEHIFQLGDVFDRRKFINYYTMAMSYQNFFHPLEKNGLRMITIVGNHDMFWKDDMSINSHSLLLSDYKNIQSISKPTVINVKGCRFAFVPWICKSNQAEVTEFLKNCNADVCMGHFEIEGFSMNKGSAPGSGLSPKVFERFDHTFSGHYHTHSIQDNIIYTGTPYELTWIDADDPKCFFIYDTDARTYEKIINPFTLFENLWYNPTLDSKLYRKQELEGKYVKLHIASDAPVTDWNHFNKCVSEITDSAPSELKVSDHSVVKSSEQASEDVDDATNVLSAIKTNIDMVVSDDAIRSDLFSYMNGVYETALETIVDKDGGL